MLCSRVRTAGAVALIWPLSALCALPTMLFNRVRPSSLSHIPIQRCGITFPGDHVTGMTAYKLCEFVARPFGEVALAIRSRFGLAREPRGVAP